MTVKLNLVSTVWTKCGGLGAFFAHSERFFQKVHPSGKFHCDDETTIKVLRSLESMDQSTLRDFFPTIINQICHIAGTSKVVGTACLKFLIFAFHSLIEAGFESVIEQYVRLRFLSGWEEHVATNKIKEPISKFNFYLFKFSNCDKNETKSKFVQSELNPNYNNKAELLVLLTLPFYMGTWKNLYETREFFQLLE